jgi:holo-[acyl-carrier protein] synthase
MLAVFPDRGKNLVSDYPTAPLIGVDLVEPGRLADRLSRTPGLVTGLFREDEIAYCEAQIVPAEHFASRFCAKEAVKKALGLDAWDPRDIEIVGGGDACVSVRLHDDARRRAADLGVELTISMSHLESVAVAVALARPAGL